MKNIAHFKVGILHVLLCWIILFRFAKKEELMKCYV